MEASFSPPTMDEDAEEQLMTRSPIHPTKKRKTGAEKTVVRLRIGSEFGSAKNEGPPHDSWSWRKYGQKPIKGSPYLGCINSHLSISLSFGGYYRCSTSKGCSAKKQVERCKSDASVLIVTYMSSHNHPKGGSGSNADVVPSGRKEKQISLECSLDPHTMTSRENDHQEGQDGAYTPTVESAVATEAEEFRLYGLGGVVLLEEEESISSGSGPTGNIDRLMTPIPATAAKSEVDEEEEEYYDFFDELKELYPTVGLYHHHQLVR